jgi:hypothetical protein
VVPIQVTHHCAGTGSYFWNQNRTRIGFYFYLKKKKNQIKNWIPDSIMPRSQREEKAPAQIQNPRPCSKPLTCANPKPKVRF